MKSLHDFHALHGSPIANLHALHGLLRKPNYVSYVTCVVRHFHVTG